MSACRRLAAAAATALLGSAALTVATGTAHAVVYRPASNGAKLSAVKWIKQGSELDFTVDSRALSGKYQVRVLVPKSWRQLSLRTWPVVYAFHGGRDSYLSWTRSTDIEELAARYDAMVVMPAGDNGSYTNWWNDGRGGTPKWETFHMTEVRELVERNFHAGASRACMGNSSGGQGCMTYAARFPGTFRYAASFSGLTSILSPGLPSMILLTAAGEPGVNPFDIYGSPIRDRANWAAHDPASLAARLRGTKIHISSGTTGMPGPFEQPGMPLWDIGLLSERAVGYSNIQFRDRLTELRIPVGANIYGNGRHSWPYWIRELHSVWPDVMGTIGAPRSR